MDYGIYQEEAEDFSTSTLSALPCARLILSLFLWCVCVSVIHTHQMLWING